MGLGDVSHRSQVLPLLAQDDMNDKPKKKKKTRKKKATAPRGAASGYYLKIKFLSNRVTEKKKGAKIKQLPSVERQAAIIVK